jgi:hypothetical protein
MVLIEEGTESDRSDEQCSKADSSSTEVFDSDSNVKVKSALQYRKQWSEIVSIDRGIVIASSDSQYEKRDLSRTESAQPG